VESRIRVPSSPSSWAVDLLTDAMAFLAEFPGGLYIWGPPSAGKTVLMRSLSQALVDDGAVVLTVRLDSASSPDSIRRDLLQLSTTTAGDDADRSWPEYLDDLNRAAATSPLVLCFDDYDTAWSWDEWLRRNVFERLRSQITILMTGRQPPSRLWAGDRLWRERIGTYRVPDLSRDEVADFLRQATIDDVAAHNAVYQLSGGRIGFVARMADALSATDVEVARRILPPAPARGDSSPSTSVVSFLVEHVLHPGSRRESWRAGAGRDSIDMVVAAASMVPFFRRGLMQTLVERNIVDRFWPALVELPIVRRYEGGYYAIEEPLRSQIEALVVHARPWASARWRHIARGHLISQLDKDDPVSLEASWTSLIHLLPDRKTDEFRLAGSPWTFEWAAQTEGDHPGLNRSVRDGPLQLEPDAVVEPIVVTARTADGTVVGEMRTRSGRTATWGSVTIIDQIAWDPVHPGVSQALAWEAAKAWIHCDVVVWAVGDIPQAPGEPFATQELEAAGFEPGEIPGNADAWVLDFRTRPFRVWLERRTVLRRPLPDGDTLANAARDALLAMGDPESLMSCEIGRRYVDAHADASVASVRTWILDALSSANLGDVPSGRALLTAYYLDRYGSHETLAEHFHVSRATYFRSHRRALELLGVELWRYV
jgi:hypothetical protein